jgi:hypothetical protein
MASAMRSSGATRLTTCRRHQPALDSLQSARGILGGEIGPLPCQRGHGFRTPVHYVIGRRVGVRELGAIESRQPVPEGWRRSFQTDSARKTLVGGRVHLIVAGKRLASA